MVLGLWFEGARATFFLFYYFERAYRFFRGPKQSSHACKTHFLRKRQVFRFFCRMPLGLFWRPFGASVVSLACWCHPVGCLWLAWAVCGLALLLLGQFEAIFACSFYVLPLLGEIMWCWGWGSESVRAMFLFFEITNALPVPMLRHVEKGSFTCMPAHCCSFVGEIRMSSSGKNGVLPAWELIS